MRLASEELSCHKNIIQAILAFQIDLSGRPQKKYKSMKPKEARRASQQVTLVEAAENFQDRHT